MLGCGWATITQRRETREFRKSKVRQVHLRRVKRWRKAKPKTKGRVDGRFDNLKSEVVDRDAVIPAGVIWYCA
jgi:hypothetical protein